MILGFLHAHNPMSGEDYSKYNFYVIRPKRSDLAELAMKYAFELVKMDDLKSTNVGYNKLGLLPATVLGHGGLVGMAQKAILGDITRKRLEEFRAKKPVTMFCSELVAYSYYLAAEDLGLERFSDIPQDRISPEELYVRLRDHDGFEYVGELHKYVR